MKVTFALLFGLVAASLHAQAMPELTFHFERPATTQTPYTFHLHPDGSGTYEAQVPALLNQPAAEVHQALAVSPATAQHLFALAEEAHRFVRPCASKARVADTGTKTLGYVGPDGTGQCTYNYSEIKPVAALTDVFLGMALTLDDGRKLAFFHRYDRLSLGAEMKFLLQAAKDGRALEMGDIAGELRALADDTEVLESARTGAATLLGTAEASGAIPRPSSVEPGAGLSPRE